MNNVRTQSRFGTTYQVSFPDFPTFNVVPQWVRLTQEQHKQDVIELGFASYDPHYQKAFKTGVLMKLKWQTQYAKGEWVGYVYNNKNKTQATVSRNVVVRGIGGSFPLKEGGNNMWKNKTAPEIVIDICKKYKLKAIVDKSNVRFGMQSLVGLTHWEKIQELGNRIGFHAYVSNSTLYFQRIDRLIDQFSSVIPVLSFNNGDVNAGVVYDAQTLDSFTANLGDLFEVGHYAKKQQIVQGIDPITGKSHSHTSTPSGVGKNLRTNVVEALFKKVVTNVVAETKDIAKELSEGLSHLARFSIHGEGQGQGDPRIAPYRTIEINGTGDVTDGSWIIKRVEHYMTFDGRYNVDFTCMSDGTGKNKGGVFRKETASIIPTRNIAYEMATGGKQAPSTPTISSRQPLVVQTRGGFKTTPNRWVGK